METTQKNKIIGKTYSLFNGKDSTDYFFEELTNVTDDVLSRCKSEAELLKLIRDNLTRKRKLKRESQLNSDESLLAYSLHLAEKFLSEYFTDIESHLKNLTLSEKCEPTLTTSKEQYLLYMLEIELVNRMNKEKFNLSKTRFAFLPHCLHDLDKECLSASDGIDYVCKDCSKMCSINSVSKIMKTRNITAYIWQEADLKKVFKIAKPNSESVGAFGVACIPELVNGLRLCEKYDVPAIGVPLDANRCVRWMGDFYSNSINEKKILSLLN